MNKIIVAMWLFLSSLQTYTVTNQEHAIKLLEKHIISADAAQFIAHYTLHSLEDTNHLQKFAQDRRAAVHAEYENTPDSTIKKLKLLKSTLQVLAGFYCAIQIVDILYASYMPLSNICCSHPSHEYMLEEPFWHEPLQKKINSLAGRNIANQFTGCLTFPGFLTYHVCHHFSGRGNGKYVTGTVAPALLALIGYGTYSALSAAVKNFKIGLNYKNHLKKQIKNLDEIIEFLTTQANTLEHTI